MKLLQAAGRFALLMLVAIACSANPELIDASIVDSSIGIDGTGGDTDSNSDVESIIGLLTSPGSSTDDHILHQEAVAACMRDLGFEYTPLPSPTERMVDQGALTPLEARREFVESYGYGVTTLYWEVELEAARARGIDSNPNEQRMATMSEAEREEFQAALLGPVISSQEGSEGVEGVERDKTDSCEQQAEDTMTRLDRNRLPDTVQQALAETMERVYADPTVRTADDAWFTCMAAAGHEVEQPEIIEGQRVGPMFPTGEQLVQSLTDSLNSSADWRTLTVEHGDGTTETVEYPVFDETALAQAQAAEMIIAEADLQCDEASKRTETILSVRDGIYEEVIQDNLSAFAEVISD